MTTPQIPTLPEAFDAYYATDAKAEKDGQWTAFDAAGIELLVARPGGSNDRYDLVLAEKCKPYAHVEMDAETDRRIMREVYAEAVVLGWRALDGSPLDVPYNAAGMAALFEKYPDFYRDLRKISNDRAMWRTARLKSDAGN